MGGFEGVAVGTSEGTVVGVELEGATVDPLFPPTPLPPLLSLPPLPLPELSSSPPSSSSVGAKLGLAEGARLGS